MLEFARLEILSSNQFHAFGTHAKPVITLRYGAEEVEGSTRESSTESGTESGTKESTPGFSGGFTATASLLFTQAHIQLKVRGN